MWILDGRPVVQKVTPKLAAEWAAMEAPGVDRPLSDQRIAKYRKMVANHQFRPVDWARVFCEEDGKWYRVNGKHTSHLFAGLSPEELNGQLVNISTFRCKSREDIPLLYGTFDSNLQNRSANDIYLQFASVIPELQPISKQIISLLVAGLAHSEWPVSLYTPGMKTATERAELLYTNTKFCLWCADLIKERRKSAHLWRAPVIAAMRSSWVKGHADATKFWEEVRDEHNPDPGNPTRVLAKFLCKMCLSSGQGAPQRLRVSAKEFYVKCAHAWSAWRKGETTRLNYHHEAKIPNF